MSRMRASLISGGGGVTIHLFLHCLCADLSWRRKCFRSVSKLLDIMLEQSHLASAHICHRVHAPTIARIVSFAAWFCHQLHCVVFSSSSIQRPLPFRRSNKGSRNVRPPESPKEGRSDGGLRVTKWRLWSSSYMQRFTLFRYFYLLNHIVSLLVASVRFWVPFRQRRPGFNRARTCPLIKT